MRTIQELLPIFLEYAESMDKVTLEITTRTAGSLSSLVNKRGLCALSYFLRKEEIITNQEEEIFDAWLSNTLGENFFLNYHWPQGEWEPRIEWLKEQIYDTSR